jgi:phosphogluconate 2-dehydrogenase
MGSATIEARDAMALATVDNLKAMIAGTRPPNIVNPEAIGEAPIEQPDRLG